MKKKTILVTGGLGYLGARLCLFLKSTGFKVVIGSSRKSAKLPKILTGCSLSFIDLNNVKLLNSVCGNVDYVIHLASINAQLSQKKSETCY